MTATVFFDLDVTSLSIDGVQTAAWRVTKKAGAAFAGGTTNGHGDFDGSGNPYALFTVTGVVEARIFGFCNTLLAGASATLEVGCAGNTAALIAQSTAVDIDANEVWVGTTPGLLAQAFPAQTFVLAGNVIETAGTANITAGQIDYYCIWRPISSNGSVVAAA